MTNRLAVILGGFITAFIVIDVLVFGAGGTTFLIRKLADLVSWVTFWR